MAINQIERHPNNVGFSVPLIERLAFLKSLNFYLALLLAAVIILPLLMMITISLNPDEQAVMIEMGSIKAFIPHVFSLENYRQIWQDPHQPFVRYLFNTLFIVFTSVILSILVNSAAAFALAWGESRFKKIILVMILAILAIPAESLVLPQLLIVSKLNMIDSYQVQILPFIGNAMSLFLFYQFFSKLPKDLIDAAKVDGVGLIKTYWHVILPISKPVITTVAILQFLEFWNSYLWPIMVTRGPEYRPLSVAMSAYFSSNQAQWGNIMAFAVSMAIPVIIFFLFVQRHFVQSITGTAVKG